MARPKKVRYLVGDFETTVYDDQKNTEVWASAIVEMFTEDVSILHSIDEAFNKYYAYEREIFKQFKN